MSDDRNEPPDRAAMINEARHANDERFRKLVELLPEALFAHRKGLIIYANTAFARMLGFTHPADVLGHPVLDFVPDEDHALVTSNMHLVHADGRPNRMVEARFIRKGGAFGFMETSAVPFDFGGIQAKIVVVRDVTAQKETERALRESEAKYRHLVETTRDGVCITDAEGRVTFTNRRFDEIFGSVPGSILGKTLIERMDEPLRGAARERLERRRQGISEGGELKLKNARGEDVWVIYESSPIQDGIGDFTGTFVTLVDITTRKATEEQIRRSEAQLREAQEIANVGSWELDLATNVITRSDALCRIQGWTREESDANPEAIYTRLHPDDRERVKKELESATRERRGFTMDYRLLRADGVRSLHVRAELFRDADGKPIRLVGVAQDVTERKQMEARLLVSDRMASVGTLASGVAHEINNPLSSVTANLDMLVEEIRAIGGGSPSGRFKELEDMADEARRGAERVRTIVRGLKTFSRADEERRVPLDLRRVVELSVNLVFNELRHRARLVKDFGPVPQVMADEARLGQVFINLLLNAAQALTEGGADRNEIRIVMSTDAAGNAVVEMRDTGAGIAPEVLERIFDPFFTTKAIGSSTGLGLFICHSIVTSLGGSIRAESELGKGSVFRIVLPALALERTSEPSLAPAALPTVRRGRVLILDDDIAVGTALKRLLGTEHDVVVMTKAREAVSRLVGGDAFDIILCDLMMPEMTGMEVHAELSRAIPPLADRIVFITGGAFSPAAKRFLDEVPNHRFEKPFDTHTLRAVVRDRVRPAS